MTKYGCKKSPTDARDYKIDRLRVVAPPPVKLPPKVDYTDEMPSVKNQYNEGACVGFAATTMKDWQEWKEHHCKYDFSKRYIYERARAIDGLLDDEEGTTIRAAMEILYKHGVCEESCWPYYPHLMGTPCTKADELAKPFRTKMYIGLDTIAQMKEALVTNGPFVMGIIVYESFENDDNGVIPMPGENEKILGAHAICIVGYDDAKKLFKFQNSWGGLWGDGGYGYLHYDYEPDMFDGWTAADETGDAPRPKSWWERFLDWLRRLKWW